MKTDDQVKAAVSLKKDMIVNTGWKIECEDNEIKEFVEKSFKELNEKASGNASFEDILRDVLSTFEYGFSLTEPVYEIIDGKYTYKSLKTRPPHTFKFNLDDRGNVVKVIQSQPGGEKEFDPSLFIHHVYQQEFGNPYGLSDLSSAHAAWKMKKYVLRFYAMYLERWANPTMVGKYEPNMDPNEIQRLHDMLKTLQSHTVFAFPNNVMIDLVFPQRDGGDSYNKAVDLTNMMISRSILVPDLLGIGGSDTKGGSFALGKEQFKVFLGTIYKDRQSLERKISLRLVRPLVKANFGDSPCEFKFIEYTEDDISKYADIWVKAVSSHIFKPNPEEINHLRSITGFPEGEVELPEPVETGPDGKPLPPGAKPGEDKDDKKANGKDQDKEKQPPAPPKDKEFSVKQFRKQTVYEQKVDFTVVEKILNSNETAITRELGQAAKRIWKDYIQQIREKGIIRRFRPEALNDIKPKFLKDMNLAFRNGFRDLFRESIDEAKNEILPNGVGKTLFVSKCFEALMPDEFEEVFESEAFKTVKDYSDTVVKKGGNILVNGIKEGQSEANIVTAMSDVLTDETETWISAVVRTKTTEVYNLARRSYWENDDVAKQLVVAYQFSAIMDSRTSEICASLDEDIFERADEVARITPPLHFFCRSLLVPITKFEEYEPSAIPSIEAIREKGGNLKNFEAK